MSNYIPCPNCKKGFKKNYIRCIPHERIYLFHCFNCGKFLIDKNNEVVGKPQRSDLKQLALV